MLIKYLNIARGERTKNVNGNDYDFRLIDGKLLCEVPEPDCHVLLKNKDLFSSEDDEVLEPSLYKLEDIDVNDIDQVIEFANSVQDEKEYTRRNSLENMLADLKTNGY